MEAHGGGEVEEVADNNLNGEAVVNIGVENGEAQVDLDVQTGEAQVDLDVQNKEAQVDLGVEKRGAEVDLGAEDNPGIAAGANVDQAEDGGVNEAGVKDVGENAGEIILVKHNRSQWPAQVVARNGSNITVQIINKHWALGKHTLFDESHISEFVYNEALLKRSTNNELKTAYRKAKNMKADLVT